MDREKARLAAAHLKNLEYIRRLEAQELEQSLQQNVNDLASLEARQQQQQQQQAAAAAATTTASSALTGSRKRKNSSVAGPRNTSVYITGLTTFMACKQLEGMCMQLGKVRRIKFYEDERGRLKGDATVTFHSHAAVEKAIDRLDGLEIKPGIMLTASMAEFKKKQPETEASPGQSHSDPPPQQQQQDDDKSSSTGHDGHATTQVAVQSPHTRGVISPPHVSSSESKHDDEELDFVPSRGIILDRVFDPLELNEPSFVDELQQDMESECRKYGNVEMVLVRPDGSVKIQFTELPSAIRCLQVMNGRWFGGRQLQAHFDPTQQEETQDSDTKLQAFLASVG